MILFLILSLFHPQSCAWTAMAGIPIRYQINRTPQNAFDGKPGEAAPGFRQFMHIVPDAFGNGFALQLGKYGGNIHHGLPYFRDLRHGAEQAFAPVPPPASGSRPAFARSGLPGC